MAVAQRPLLELDDSFTRDVPELAEPWQPVPVPEPRLLAFNDDLAAELGIDADALRSPEGVAVLVGNAVPDGARPIAQAYAGHQFGGFSPRLGDGRALLLGELTDRSRRVRDLQLKGSGRTPFARGGDGKAAVGPMLREYLMGEAMHALGIPTTRMLSVVATGEPVRRETILPGAVLARVAASHLRVGTFEYATTLGVDGLEQRLADHAIARHHPELAGGGDERYLAFYEAVVDAQAHLVSQWMLVGFIHGVMNTDNTTISGETIDYGPCAMMDAYDPATVFSSIDHGGRYSYGNQPAIAQWNLARLAETMLPLLGRDTDSAVAAATDVLTTFPDRHQRYWLAGMRRKLGLVDTASEASDDVPAEDREIADDLMRLLQAHRVDLTRFHRAASSAVRGDVDTLREVLPEPGAFDGWIERWLTRVAPDGSAPHDVADHMDRVNPVYIPRNHLVEEALDEATAGDLATFERLLAVVTRPFDERPGLDRYAEAAPPDFGRHVTYCGT